MRPNIFLAMMGTCCLCLSPFAAAGVRDDTAIAGRGSSDDPPGQHAISVSTSGPFEHDRVPGLPAHTRHPLPHHPPDVAVSMATKDGLSRLTFDWPEAIGYDVSRRGDFVTVIFDRPGRMDLSSLIAGSDGRLIGALIEDDGRRVILMTRGDLDINVRTGEHDLRPPDRPAPNEAPMISLASVDHAEVTVRAGEHDGFSRLVFDWPLPIGHDVQQDGDQIAISFDQPGRIDVSSLVEQSAGRLTGAYVEENGRRVVLTTAGVVLTTAGEIGVVVRDYEDNLLVLDLAAPTGDRTVVGNSIKSAVIPAQGVNAQPSPLPPPATDADAEPRSLGPSESVAQPSAPADQPPPTGPGQFDVDEDALDRALERTLAREGVILLPSGTVEIEPSFTYIRRESQAPTQEDLFGLFSQVRETEIRRDEFDFRLALDVGLPFDTQLELSQSFRHIDQTTLTSAGFVGLDDSDESANAFDDLVVGLAKGLLKQDHWWPDIVARVTWDTPIGDDSEGNIGLGGGANEVTGSLSFVKSEDPLAFFGSVSYGYSFEEDGFDPGDQIGISLGTSLAAGPDTSLRLALSQSFSRKAEIDGTPIPGSQETSASLTAGASLVLGRGVLLDTSVTAGLTDDAPDYSARVALPIRFRPF